MSDKPRRRPAKPKSPQPEPQPAATVTTADPAPGLTSEVLHYALSMMLPDDMSLLFDVRLITRSREVARVFGANTLSGMAGANRIKTLATNVENFLRSLVLEPMQQKMQDIMQEALMQDEIRLSLSAPSAPVPEEDNGSVLNDEDVIDAGIVEPPE